jgi:hypothetical protein
MVRLSPWSGELGFLRVTVIFTPSGGWNPPRYEVDWCLTAGEGIWDGLYMAAR